MLPFIPTSAGGFIGPLKWINHFPLPGLSTSHPLSPHFLFGFYSQTVYTNWGGCGVCVDCVHVTTQSTCATQVCINPQSVIIHAYNTSPADCVCVCRHMAACAQQVSQLTALGAFHVHYHLFYSGIFKSGGLGMTVAIVREQRRALRVSGGCGMQSAELFSKCCTPHFMESQGGWPGQPCRQTELNSTHSCINGSLCAIPPH